MIEVKQPLRLAAVVLLVVSGITYLQLQHPPRLGEGGMPVFLENQSSIMGDRETRIQEKAERYERARELVNPSGFINAEPFTLSELVGEKIILLDMWTYSCINCQRTLPYLNQWWTDYRDDGLVIIGNHAPEFAFEKKRSNVEAAVDRFNITYPVVLDNEYGTWRAYNNRYWPQKYLIGIDGFVRYEHIGEGGYTETRNKIEELLEERKQVLGAKITVERSGEEPAAEQPFPLAIGTPELYFGAWRNNRLGNGEAGRVGAQNLTAPETLQPHRLYLDGRWRFTSEYAEALEPGASILLTYRAKNVYMVLHAPGGVNATVRRDGELLAAPGRDVVDGVMRVAEEQLYNVVQDTAYGLHTLNITAEESGLRAYTFTFG